MDQSLLSGLSGDDDDNPWLNKYLRAVDNGAKDDDLIWFRNFFEALNDKCDEFNDALVGSSGVKESSKDCGKEAEEEDDDCVILDGDPDKAGDVKSENVAVGDDSEELVLVGETGKV